MPLTFARNWYPATRFADLPEVLERTGGISAAMAEFGVKDYHAQMEPYRQRAASSRTWRGVCKINRQQPVLWVENVDVDEQGMPIKYGFTHFAADRVQLMVEHDL